MLAHPPPEPLAPAQLDAFKAHCDDASERSGRPPTYIVKPSGGSQGTGIYLIRQADQLQATHNAVVQEYVETPLLLEGLKFDLRLYCLVLSVQPLTAYLYKGGMARYDTRPSNPCDLALPASDLAAGKLACHAAAC